MHTSREWDGCHGCASRRGITDYYFRCSDSALYTSTFLTFSPVVLNSRHYLWYYERIAENGVKYSTPQDNKDRLEIKSRRGYSDFHRRLNQHPYDSRPSFPGAISWWPFPTYVLPCISLFYLDRQVFKVLMSSMHLKKNTCAEADTAVWKRGV